MPFNPAATYRTVQAHDGTVYVSQGGKYYNSQGDELAAIPRSANGYTAPTDANLTLAATGGTVAGVTITNSPISGSTGSFTTLAASAAVTLSPANAAVSLSPTGTGVVTINPATAGTINNCSIGVTTPAVVRTSNLQATFTDSSATPGNVTNNSPRGKAAFAAAGTAVVVTNSLVAATSTVLCVLETADATLTQILRATPAAGSFTVTGNAAATATTTFSFLVVN